MVVFPVIVMLFCASKLYDSCLVGWFTVKFRGMLAELYVVFWGDRTVTAGGVSTEKLTVAEVPVMSSVSFA